MSKKIKRRSVPARRRADERTDIFAAIVQVVTRFLADWIWEWISRGGRL